VAHSVPAEPDKTVLRNGREGYKFVLLRRRLFRVFLLLVNLSAVATSFNLIPVESGGGGGMGAARAAERTSV